MVKETEFLGVPYFMNNEKWYYYDWHSMKYKLTDDAPLEAVESYEEYYADEDTE